MNFSYWEQRSFLESTDILVVGAGIVGLSTAIYLKRLAPTMDVLVIDRDPFSGGASTKNAGFACFGSLGELVDDLSRMSLEEVINLAVRRFKGLENLRNLLGDSQLDYKPCGGFELFNATERDWLAECESHLNTFNGLFQDLIGRKPYSIHPSQLFRGIESVITNKDEGSIDTAKLIIALRKLAADSGVRVINGLSLDEWNSNGETVEIRMANARFFVKKLALCTNGFARELMPELDVRPARNQVVVTSVIPGLQMEGTFHLDRGYGYFREIDGRVLLGGFRNLSLENEYTSESGLTEIIQEKLHRTLRDIILPGKDFRIDYAWSGVMGLGPTKNAIMKQLAPNVHCAVRMGGMGVAIGTLIGKELAESILQR